MAGRDEDGATIGEDEANLVAIPVAAGVLVHWGIDLPMAVGAIVMSVSTILVATNAQPLRRLQLRRDPPITEQVLAPAA